jgi:hypothetical protein
MEHRDPLVTAAAWVARAAFTVAGLAWLASRFYRLIQATIGVFDGEKEKTQGQDRSSA